MVVNLNNGQILEAFFNRQQEQKQIMLVDSGDLYGVQVAWFTPKTRDSAL